MTQALGTGATEAPAGTAAPLRVPEYRRLLAGTFVSALGLFLHTVAASWVMLELTGSPFMVGLVTAAALLPRLIAGIPAGALADIVDRRALLIGANAANAVVALILAWLQMSGALTPALLVTLSLGLGLGSSVSLPAYQAIVPDLLPRPLVAPAVSLQSGTFNVARAVGPAIGGVLVAAGLADLAFALNGVSYLAIVAAALTFRDVSTGAEQREPVGRAMATGLRYVRHTPLFLRVVLITALFALTSGAVQPLLPNMAEDVLGVGARGYGALFASFGTGALLGALSRERVSRRLPGRMIPAAITGFGLAGVAFGLSRDPVLSAVLLAAVGACWVWTLTTLNATVQLAAPGWVRGRAVGIHILAFTGLYPLGALAAGAVAEQIGAATAVSLSCALTLLVGLASPRLRLPALSDIAEPTLPDDWSVQPHDLVHVAGSPVVVVTEWEIDPDDLPRFLTAMREVRRHRYRTGAIRWLLFRNAERPRRMTEVFELPDWEEHLRQHARIDGDAVAAIVRARTFDRSGGPRTRHLVGIDVADVAAVPAWEDLLAVHAGLHERDGSIPLDRDAGDGEAERERDRLATRPRR